MNALAHSRWTLRPFGGSRILRRRISVGRHVTVIGRVWVHGNGTIRLDDDVILDARDAPIELHAHRGAVIAVAQGARIESGASLEAVARITVGAYARLGRFAKIMDNNFHPLDSQHRLPPSRPITVGERCDVGDRAILLPGASVAPHSAVPAGAVVSRPFGFSPRSFRAAFPDPIARERGPNVPIQPGVVGKLRATTEIIKAAWYLRACERGLRVRAGGAVLVRNAGRVRVGSHVVLLGGMMPTSITCGPNASIEIGAASIFNYGVSLDAAHSIRIGQGCRLGSLVRIADHGTGKAGPVIIGDGVWIAYGASIEPGVTIGAGSVVSAGSRVSVDVPSHSLAIGNPARCMSLTFQGER